MILARSIRNINSWWNVVVSRTGHHSGGSIFSKCVRLISSSCLNFRVFGAHHCNPRWITPESDQHYRASAASSGGSFAGLKAASGES